MDQNEFLREQFLSLRREIQSRQARIYWTAIIGLLGVPMLTYFAADKGSLVWLILPYFVLVVILLFMAEQNAMMRAGRYIREEIEPALGKSDGWEAWLESRGELRLMEKHFFACFIIIFFLYYFFSIGLALHQLWLMADSDPSGVYRYWLYGALVCYAIGALWGISTLVHHWKSSLGTSSGAANSPSQ
ncbi:MAG: hypothetical protein ACE5EQ_06095 [Phycisphaerae bacterium]